MASNTLDLGSWFILRMSSGDTMKVQKALSEAGHLVWTPVEKRARRMPRTKAIAECEYALMPSYAFAHVDGLDAILRLAMMPQREMPRFSVFHHQGAIPLIADGALAPLRQEEQRCLSVFERFKKRVTKGPRFNAGETVTVPEGPFQGMTGVVEDSSGQFSMVRFTMFGKTTSVKVSSLLLRRDVVDAGESDKRALRHRNATKYMGDEAMLEDRFFDSAKHA